MPAPVGFNSPAVSCDCLAPRFGNATDHPDRERRYPSDMTDVEWAVVRDALAVPGAPTAAPRVPARHDRPRDRGLRHVRRHRARRLARAVNWHIRRLVRSGQGLGELHPGDQNRRSNTPSASAS